MSQTHVKTNTPISRIDELTIALNVVNYTQAEIQQILTQVRRQHAIANHDIDDRDLTLKFADVDATEQVLDLLISAGGQLRINHLFTKKK